MMLWLDWISQKIAKSDKRTSFKRFNLDPTFNLDFIASMTNFHQFFIKSLRHFNFVNYLKCIFSIIFFRVRHISLYFIDIKSYICLKFCVFLSILLLSRNYGYLSFFCVRFFHFIIRASRMQKALKETWGRSWLVNEWTIQLLNRITYIYHWVIQPFDDGLIR